MPRSHVLPRRTHAAPRACPSPRRRFLAAILLLTFGTFPALALEPSRAGSAATKPIAAAAEALTYWIELLEAPVGPGPQVPEQRIFHSGEKIRLHVRSSREGFVSLVQVRPSGPLSVLFPRETKSLKDNRVRANEDRILPTESYWFSFDEKPGKEELLLLFSTTREALAGLTTLAVRGGAGTGPGVLRIELRHQ